MPIEFKFFSIEEVADKLGLKKECERKSLSQYCSRRKLGQKIGHARVLTEAEIEVCKNRKEGRPKKISEMKT